MPESFLPGCEEHLRGLSLEGSLISPWAPSPDTGRLFPVERDLISKLQVPKVIRPHPARPVRTIICIDCSNIVVDATTSVLEVAMSNKTPREVEIELELPDALPAIVAGYNNNRVYLANDAYKAMVGQPIYARGLTPYLGLAHLGGSTVRWS